MNSLGTNLFLKIREKKFRLKFQENRRRVEIWRKFKLTFPCRNWLFANWPLLNQVDFYNSKYHFKHLSNLYLWKFKLESRAKFRDFDEMGEILKETWKPNVSFKIPKNRQKIHDFGNSGFLELIASQSFDYRNCAKYLL